MKHLLIVLTFFSIHSISFAATKVGLVECVIDNREQPWNFQVTSAKAYNITTEEGAKICLSQFDRDPFGMCNYGSLVDSRVILNLYTFAGTGQWMPGTCTGNLSILNEHDEIVLASGEHFIKQVRYGYHPESERKNLMGYYAARLISLDGERVTQELAQETCQTLRGIACPADSNGNHNCLQ